MDINELFFYNVPIQYMSHPRCLWVCSNIANWALWGAAEGKDPPHWARPTHAARSRQAPILLPDILQDTFRAETWCLIQDNTILIHTFLQNLTIVSVFSKCNSPALWILRADERLRTPQGTNQLKRGCEGTRLPGGSRQHNFHPNGSLDKMLRTSYQDNDVTCFFGRKIEGWIHLSSLRVEWSLEIFRAILLPCGRLLASPSTEECTAHFN